MIEKLEELCASSYLEYTIEGGSKHPNKCVRIWSTWNKSFNIYGIGATLDQAISSAIKQINRHNLQKAIK